MSIKDFQFLSKLGGGAYSSVYKVKRIQDGQEYALKKVKINSLSEKEKENALNEVRFLASIRHQNIVCYKESFIEPQTSSLCIIMEYADKGDLYQKILHHQKNAYYISEDEIWNIVIQITNGLKILHQNNILHRDLKSANVFLFSNGISKLGDMNVSKLAKNGLLYTQTGTPYYASPEVWKDQPYDAKSDMWSLGCVLYEMITLKPPFRAEDMEALYKKVIRGYYNKIPQRYSNDLAQVIKDLLQVGPHFRPNTTELLQKPYFSKHISDQLQITEDPTYLLKTIKVPKKWVQVTNHLPKPNYNDMSFQMLDKQEYLNSLRKNKNRSQNVSPKKYDESKVQLSVDYSEMLLKQAMDKPKLQLQRNITPQYRLNEELLKQKKKTITRKRNLSVPQQQINLPRIY